MFFIIPIVLAIFCPMTYFLVQEIIWPELPLTLPPAPDFIRAMIAAPPCSRPSPCPKPLLRACPRWSPAVTEECTNVFSAKYIFENGLPPETPATNMEMIRNIHNNMLSKYPYFDVVAVIISCFILLAIVAAALRLWRRDRKTPATVNTTHDPMVHLLLTGTEPALPVTTVAHTANTIELSTLTYACIRLQTGLWRRAASKYKSHLVDLTQEQRELKKKIVQDMETLQQTFAVRVAESIAEKQRFETCITALEAVVRDKQASEVNSQPSTSEVDLRTELEVKTQDLQKVRDELESSKGREDEVNTQLSVMKKTLAGQEHEIKSLSNSLLEMKQELAQTEKDQAEQSEELGVAYAKETALSQQLKSVNTRSDALEAELTSVRLTAATKAHALDEAIVEMTTAEARARIAEAELAKQQVANGKSSNDLAHKDAQLQYLANELKELRISNSKVEKLESDLTLKQKINEQLKLNAESVKQGLEKEVSELKVQKSKLVKTVKDAEETSQNNLKQAQAKLDPQLNNKSSREIRLEALLMVRNTEITQLKLEHEQALKRTKNGDDRQEYIDRLQENHAAEKHMLEIVAGNANYEAYCMEQQIMKLEAELEKATAATSSTEKQNTPAATSTASTTSPPPETDSIQAPEVQATGLEVQPSIPTPPPAPVPAPIPAPELAPAAKLSLSKNKDLGDSKWAKQPTTPATVTVKKTTVATQTPAPYSPSKIAAPAALPAPASTSTPTPPATTNASAGLMASKYSTFADRTPSAPLPSYPSTTNSAPRGQKKYNGSGSGRGGKKGGKSSGLTDSKWAS